MSNSSTKLFTLKQFNDLHHKKNMSIYQIAEKYDTYPNKVRRQAKSLGAKIRNKSEAQKVALKTGRQQHPTKGKTRDEEVKIKISESVASVWENMTKTEHKRRRKLAREQWKNMSDADKQALRDKASIGIRHAAKHGSKLEVAILEWLIDNGYEVVFHKTHLIGNEKMHIDILVTNIAAAVEIDGPSHSEPIWGKDKLAKSQRADAKKDGLLLGRGISIIRVKQKKDLTKKLVRDILLDLEDVLEQIENTSKSTRYFIGE